MFHVNGRYCGDENLVEERDDQKDLSSKKKMKEEGPNSTKASVCFTVCYAWVAKSNPFLATPRPRRTVLAHACVYIQGREYVHAARSVKSYTSVRVHTFVRNRLCFSATAGQLPGYVIFVCVFLFCICSPLQPEMFV